MKYDVGTLQRMENNVSVQKLMKQAEDDMSDILSLSSRNGINRDKSNDQLHRDKSNDHLHREGSNKGMLWMINTKG